MPSWELLCDVQKWHRLHLLSNSNPSADSDSNSASAPSSFCHNVVPHRTIEFYRE